MKLTCAFLTLSIASTLFTHISLAEDVQHLATITNATPKDRVHPNYPSHLGRKGIEGWARASYIVEADGSVSNVIITASSGYKSFEKETKKALKRWKFSPAQENGQAIQQCHNDVQIDFALGGKDDGVSRKFLSKYNKLKEALEKEDIKSSEELLLSLENQKQKHLSEHVYLQLIKADYAKLIDNKALELSSLSGISLSNKKVITPERNLSILHQKFILNVQLSRYKSALSLYDELAKLKLAQPYLPHLAKIKMDVEAVISGDKKIIIKANIKEKDFWSHSLVRNNFSLTDIQGSLNKLDIRCANKRHVYTIETDNTWTIPESWQGCSLYIYGENNSQFTLIEYPDKSQSTAAIN